MLCVFHAVFFDILVKLWVEKKEIEKRHWVSKEAILPLLLAVNPSRQPELTLALYSPRWWKKGWMGLLSNYERVCTYCSVPQEHHRCLKRGILICCNKYIIKYLYFPSLWLLVPFGNVTAMGVCYFDLMWRFHNNSKRSHCRFSKGNKSGWCKRPWPTVKMCWDISCARRDTHSRDWHFQGCQRWWLRTPFWTCHQTSWLWGLLEHVLFGLHWMMALLS